MDFIHPDILHYAEDHSTDESDLLRELNRETHARVLMPRMLSGHLQGRILSMFSHMIRPVSVLEIGTYTGYSAICLAEGLQAGGIVHSIDINDELTEMAGDYIRRAGYADAIRLYTGDAREIIPQMPGPFDLVFIDADKINYEIYYNLVINKVRANGIIIADNVLWSGKVLLPKTEVDQDTQALQYFNDLVHCDIRVEHVMLPVRDGLLVVRKK